MAEAWILDAIRTPRGRGNDRGALRGVHPQELLAQVLRELIARTGLEPSDVEDVVTGCVSEVGEQGSNMARLAVLAAGWPVDSTGGVTINRFCGSGQQAVNYAASSVIAGVHDVVIGSGVESMSRVPMGADKGGLHGRNPALNVLHPLVPQGVSADLIAALEGFERRQLDEFGLLSQQRAAVAQHEGRFARSLIPVVGPDGEILLDRDEHPRSDATIEALAALAPAFAAVHTQVAKGDSLTFAEKVATRYPGVEITPVHTAGTSSGIVDGAGGVVVASSEWARAHGAVPRARIVSMATVAVDPIVMLTAPADTARRALQKAGMTVGDVDLFEVNEAFAAIPMKFVRDLGIDMDIVNVNGGAIALGHPIGATGAMLFSTILDELERTDRTVGLVTMCIGAGQGTATVIERI